MVTMIAMHNEPGQFEIYLHELITGVYQVTYGAQITTFQPDEYLKAVEDFQSCVRHAMECNGYFDED